MPRVGLGVNTSQSTARAMHALTKLGTGAGRKRRPPFSTVGFWTFALKISTRYSRNVC
jgi:hypothetical protein